MQCHADLKLNRGTFELHAQLDVSLRGITALFGQSGCGKTSLLRSLAGLERATGVLKLGENVWQDASSFRPPHRRHVGYIFQDADLFAHLTVEKNLLYGYSRRRVEDRRFQPDAVIDLLQIRALLARRVGGLSGGEKQLVSLGRALLSSPNLLLMDEPLAALDLKTRLGIYPLLRRIAETMGIPILYVSHSLDEVARLADQMILMSAGRVVATGKITDMLTRLDLPLAQSLEAEVVIQGQVAEHDAVWQLTAISFSGGTFMIPNIAASVGDAVRLRVAASDVSVSLSRPADSSIVNIFPARVIETGGETSALMLIKLDLNGTTVLARVTRRSFDTLGLKVGSDVFAQVKGAAVLV